MPLLTQLPPEILHNVLSWVEPQDLLTIPRACRFLYQYIKGNMALARDVYLNFLDAPPTNDLDWEKEIHDLVRLKAICSRTDVDKKAELPFVFNTVTRLLRNAARGRTRTTHSVTHPPSRNADLLTQLFKDEENRDAFMCRSFIFERARNETNRFSDPPKEEHQQSAKLHCLYGMPRLKHGRTRSSKMYPFACSKVYDLREYTPLTRWGPFQNDGSDRVDWEKVEAVLLVLRSNIKKKGLDSFPVFANFWNTPFAGPWPNSYLPMPAAPEPPTPLEAMDPYDVSGTWLRVVCFLDYIDFSGYNFPHQDQLPDNVPRPHLDIGEATRLIIMKIRVTKIEPPGPDDGQDLPVVHFRGVARSLEAAWNQNANSGLRGTCRLTREGEVRWTTFSIFSGVSRWRSEGIQVGGVRSARGVVGNWFDKDYDPRGPCGPTAFWKISDRESKTEDGGVVQNDFLSIVDLGDDGDHASEGEGNGGDDENHSADFDDDYTDDPDMEVNMQLENEEDVGINYD